MRKVYQITWRDSRRYTYQMQADEKFDVCEIITVGFFVEEDTKQIIICQDLIEEDFRGIIVIPKENIMSKKKLTCKN